MDSPGDFREGLAQVIHHVAVHGAAHAQKRGQRKFWKGAEKLAGQLHGQGKVEPAISRSDFEKGLSRFFQPPADGHIRPKRLRDAEFRDIAQWCTSYGKDDWGRRPRTFFILRMIGCEEALDGFVEEHLSDFSLPYSEENLPHAVSGDLKRKQFLEYQNYVLTDHAHDLEKEGGEHQNIEGNADGFFKKERELGSGGFGEVDEVVSYLSIKHYARKRFGRGRSFRKDQVSIKNFENELQILKKLSHRHLVKLIGSYTDRSWVGIIMTPVADMDLFTYLDADRVSPRDKQDRQICLRRFFGCLATALRYLHGKEIRHKDIKPKNILVKNREVFLADFGTSHNWSDDTRSTTEGTARGFTPRYCAPEVAHHGSRNPSTDIWSLGCVFIEMATVIHNQTVKDMNTFFERNGTGQLSVRSNPEATHLWINELAEHTVVSHDVQPLHLSQKMIRLVPRERPTAPQVVSDILDFKELPNLFCGACCDKSNDSTWTVAEENQWPETRAAMSASLAELDDSTDDTYNVPIEWEETEHTIQSLPGENASASEDLGPWPHAVPDQSRLTAEKPENRHNWQQPVADQVEDGATLRDIYPDEKDLSTAGRPSGDHVSTSKFDGTLNVIHEDSESETTQIRVEKSKAASQSGPNTSNSAKQSPDSADPHVGGRFTSSSCRWPSCGVGGLLFDGPKSLNSHYREIHLVHDFAGSHLVAGEVQPRLDQSRIAGEGGSRSFVLLGQSPTQKATKTGRMEAERPSGSQAASGNAMDEKRSSMAPKSSDELQSGAKGRDSGRARPKTTRFDLLPEDRRPEPATSLLEPDGVDVAYHEIMPEALEEPPLRPDSHAVRGPSEPPQATGGWRIPKSSRVPSYFLASTNRFTRTELDALIPRARLSSLVPPPLFVYGSLMFPSILRAQAESFIGTEGIYSELHQRRLRTDVSDWAKVMSLSIQHAAEQMTPAILKGYDRWRPSGFRCAVIETAECSPQICNNFLREGEDKHLTGQVPGFLIFGLSEEALKCFDHLLSNQELQKSYRKGIAENVLSSEGRFFKRDRVRVEIGIKGGGTTTTEAMTYAYGNRLSRLQYRWDINEFVKSKTFQSLSGGAKKKSVWMAEEEKLAEIIGMTLVLGGDAMCDAVLRDDREQLCKLLEGEDINAPCRNYGTVLQAAAAEGKLELVEFLLKKNADVNARGGQYSNALIAATVRGREEIARMLIKAGADVLADGGQYVSPLYQAVDFSDPDLAHLLLEKGAWLSKDYQELLDLAAERGNREVVRMLETYDVRNLHLAKSTDSERTSERTSDRGRYELEEDSDIDSQYSSRDLTSRRDRERELQRTSADTVKKLLWEFLILKGQPGKWTGIKGVRILRAANPTGVSEKLLGEIRPHLRRGYKMLDVLKNATMNREDGVNLSMLSKGAIKDRETENSSSNVEHRPRRYTAGTASRADDGRSRRGRDDASIPLHTEIFSANKISGPTTRLNRARRSIRRC